MDKKKFRSYSVVISALMGAGVGISVANGKPGIALAVLLTGQWSIYWLKSRVKEVMEDEMITMYAGKAAKKVFEIFGLLISAGSMVFIALKSREPYFEYVGYTLAFSAVTMVLIYAIAYYYYTRGLRGLMSDDNE